MKEFHEAMEGIEEFGDYALQKFLERMAEVVSKKIGDKVFEYLVTMLEFGIEVTEEDDYEIVAGDYVVEYPVIDSEIINIKNTTIVFDASGKVKGITLIDYFN